MMALDDALDDVVAFSLGRRRAARTICAPGQRVGLGVIGVGRWGEILARCFSTLPEVRLVALASRRVARRAELQAGFPTAALYDDPEALLRSATVDAVVIATPAASHHVLARRALEYGKHVLVEKPFTQTLAQADELIAMAAGANRILMVDHTWLFEEGMRRIKALIAGGEHGRLVEYRGQIARPLASGTGGALAGLGVHHVALLDFLAGEPPVWIRGEAVVDADGVDRSCRVELWHASELHAEIVADGSPDARRVTEVAVELSDGTRAVWTLGEAQRLTVDGPQRAFVSALYREVDALTEIARHFIACVTNGRVPLSDGATGRRTIAVLEACARACRDGQSRTV